MSAGDALGGQPKQEKQQEAREYNLKPKRKPGSSEQNKNSARA